MRVLRTIHHSLDLNSGAPGAELSLKAAFRSSGCDARLISHDDLPQWIRGKLSLLVFPLWVAFAAIRGRRQWDVIDCTSYDGWFVSLLPRWLRPKVFAFHSHGLEHAVHDQLMADVAAGRQRVSWRYWLYRGSIHLWMVARSARAADTCFLLNRHEQRYAIDRLGVSPGRIHMAVNGLSQALIESAATADRPVQEPARPLNLAFIGTYIERKGIRYLMPAIADYLMRHPEARALLLGTGVDRRSIIGELPEWVQNRVDVRPSFRRDDLPGLVVDFHILVQPSLCEGFGMAGIEGMVCGLVPIVTRDQGFDAYAVDGENSILIDPADTAQIIKAIDRLNENREEWQRMQSEAIRVAATFTWERAAAIQFEGYTAAMAEQAGTGSPTKHER